MLQYGVHRDNGPEQQGCPLLDGDGPGECGDSIISHIGRQAAG